MMEPEAGTAVGEPQRYFFVHLQKTGGTALYQRLRDQFGVDAVYPTPDDQGSPRAVIDTDFLAQRFSAHRDRLRVITGHFPLCTADLLGVPFSTFTVLRDPVDRTLSFLRHQRMIEDRFAASELEEIYAERGLHDLVDNHMVKMLSLTTDEMTAGTMTPMTFDRSRLDTAKHNLAERIDVFGLQEHFDEFCGEIAARFAWNLGRPRFANRTPALDASADLRARIADDNRYDVELYRFAADLWEERSRRRHHGARAT